MSEEKEDSEMCHVCGEWCGKDRAAQVAEDEARIMTELKELRKYKEENEKTLANYRAIAEKWRMPPIRGGRMIGDTSDE